MGLYESILSRGRTGARQFGNWSQVGPDIRLRIDSLQKKTYAVFQCECGSNHLLLVGHIDSGRTSSCRKCMGERSAKHRLVGTKVYRAWSHMKDRCQNPLNPEYRNYGGRGISVCDEWKHDFEKFLSHIGNPPSPAHQLDRIDNDAGYCPGNVRWASPSENSRNTRKTLVLEYAGRRWSYSELSESCGISKGALKSRIKRGWSVQDAVTTSVRGAVENA